MEIYACLFEDLSMDKLQIKLELHPQKNREFENFEHNFSKKVNLITINVTDHLWDQGMSDIR